MNTQLTEAPDSPYQLACLLGRQPELSLAELEQYFGADQLKPISNEVAVVTTRNPFDIQRFGGVVKAGRVVAEINVTDWLSLSKQLLRHYRDKLKNIDGKITIGISVYGRNVAPRDIQKTGLTLKQALKRQGNSVRLIPNEASTLSTATSHHNKLGLSSTKLEICVFYGQQSVIIAESVGTQNITALAARDQGRPKRDAFVGMLPPKLALMMINLSGVNRLESETVPLDAKLSESAKADTSHISIPSSDTSATHSNQHGNKKSSGFDTVILDPFCGTGVVLQEAALLGYNVYGSDFSEKMVDYSRSNLDWLREKYDVHSKVMVESGDATEHVWQQPIHAVVSETYLGQPFSAYPSPSKLEQVVGNTNQIITKSLQNLAAQLRPGTLLCLAVPAWRDGNGLFTHLPLIHNIESLGYSWQFLKHVDARQIAYYREDQIVARQLLLLKRI